MLGIDRKVDVIAQMKYHRARHRDPRAGRSLPHDQRRRASEEDDLRPGRTEPGVVSTAIVPLGVTDKHKYRDRLTPVTDEFCRETIDLVAPIQNDLRRKLGTVFAFLGDEFYIRAGRKIPPKSHYRIVRARGGRRRISADRRRRGNDAAVLRRAR